MDRTELLDICFDMKKYATIEWAKETLTGITRGNEEWNNRNHQKQNLVILCIGNGLLVIHHAYLK